MFRVITVEMRLHSTQYFIKIQLTLSQLFNN